MKRWIGLPLAAALLASACVTINVYFPAAEAREVAREFVEDVIADPDANVIDSSEDGGMAMRFAHEGADVACEDRGRPGEHGLVEVTALLEAHLDNESIHLGSTLYGRRWWGTRVNPEAKPDVVHGLLESGGGSVINTGPTRRAFVVGPRSSRRACRPRRIPPEEPAIGLPGTTWSRCARSGYGF